MLVLSRKVCERIIIDDRITLTVVRIGETAVRIGIEAPPDVKVRRSELEPQAANADRGRG